MTLTSVLNVLSTVLHLVAFAAVVWLWVRLIQEKGWGHGVLGLVTCFLYPFVWGCFNARRYGLTRVVQWAAVTSLLGFFCALPGLIERLPELIELALKLSGRSQF
jgi:uncharacterized protein YqgC (DUF456 family)